MRALAVVAAFALAVSARAATPWTATWYAQAMCIHAHESPDWHATRTWNGYPSVDHGGMQIDVGSWAAFAPHGYPADPAWATPFEQLTVAYRIWRRYGWAQPWPNTSRICGLR